ncbi:hypothetical protein ACFPMF_06035 [Larkinella bovis]|uniref:Uncharacterized protein n=1 Tax=Larkinella bovis TaxID=683041 RepID=A0ABW0I929_9BACT
MDKWTVGVVFGFIAVSGFSLLDYSFFGKKGHYFVNNSFSNSRNWRTGSMLKGSNARRFTGSPAKFEKDGESTDLNVA